MLGLKILSMASGYKPGQQQGVALSRDDTSDLWV